jgi:5-methylcytosine-specific restriction protein A
MYRPGGARSPREARQAADQRRGSARSRGYTGDWDRASKAFQRDNPFCQYCEAGAFGEPCVSAAELTDHLYPQRTYAGVFWRTEWWVACCRVCHDSGKQVAEVAGRPALDRLARLLGRPALGEGEG